GVVVRAGEEAREGKERIAAAERPRVSDRVVVIKEVDASTNGVGAVLPRKIVGERVEIVGATGGGSGESSKGGHAGDVDGWPDRVGGRRGEIAVGELRADFPHQLRRELENIPGGDRLIRVVETGGGARRAESAGSPRVGAVDIVEAVAQVELVARAELMVDLHEEVGVMDGVGIEAGGEKGPGITHGDKPRVNGGDIRR